MNEPESTSAWWTGGAESLSSGIHRIPLPLPEGEGVRAVNVYVVEGDRSLTLIDAGWATGPSRIALEEGLAELGYRLGDVSRFLITHVHPAHYTQAIAVRREYGCRVWIGRDEGRTLERLADEDWDPLDPTILQLRASGAAPMIDELRAVGYGANHEPHAYGLPDQSGADGEIIDVGRGRALEVLATPGHTRGHVVFRSIQDGVLFAGDHVLPPNTLSVGFEAEQGELPLEDFLTSLAKVRALPDLQLLPAHGPVVASVHDGVDELVAHHDERLTLCRDAVNAGCETALQVARRLPWTRRRVPFAALDTFNRMLATTETLAHLRLLVARESLTSTTADGVEGFAAPVGRRETP